MTDNSKLRARLQAKKFYSRLDRLLRRYNPRQFGPAIASMVFDLVNKPSKWRYYPLHFLIHSIEANCAYHRAYHNDEITQKRIDQIVNHYKGYYDPYLQHVLQELQSLELCALAWARQQFPSQRSPSTRELARCLLLFAEDNPLPRTADRFVGAYGFKMQDWVYMSFAVPAYTRGARSPITCAANYLDSELNSIPRSAVQPFLEMSSLSPDQVADHYHSIREQFPSYLHIFIPSVFLEHPLIAYDDGTYLVVHPGFTFHHALDGLYRVCQDLDSELFHREFGGSFERYVGKVLKELTSVNRVWTESEIQRVSPGQTCDYVIDHRDCILLIECKSVRYSATLLTENAIARDNSTGKLAESFEQIRCTASRIHKGDLETILSDQKKPLFGFAVTFGDLHFANSPWYVQNFIIPRTDLRRHDQWFSPLKREPQVVSISTLEDILIVLNDQGISPPELIETKLTQEFVKIGDWPGYLATYGEKVGNWELPLLGEAVNAFFDEIRNDASDRSSEPS